MVQSAPKFLTVDEFINHYSECDRYELIDGELIEIEATVPTQGLNNYMIVATYLFIRSQNAEGIG
ncbi:MAG: hypothetical protein RMY16_31490 [Nostoc sp. DedQUE12b]|uniref:hypothetical protein n=1 Tax=Nostoc sp. DedQUE12b TaxID=3075398 RepID=UPI002AD44F6B|nr:hypothetical protein [Nostoc sp. DedQUE12b]MDZ8089571.1 hypothetical protein [Nostoc sp. DedQUE12b]MDZ8090044.1 hypothetical protein [Nostoc sp. DedQUE12b]